MNIKKRYRGKIVPLIINRLVRANNNNGLFSNNKTKHYVKYIKPKEIISLINNFNNSIEIHYSWYKLIEYQLSKNYLWIGQVEKLSTNLFSDVYKLSYFCVSDKERMFLETIKL
jgi:2-polyprenyl-3-methyl-5-hydroxy-6-metoxy-1,4-benzoquinol methylase